MKGVDPSKNTLGKNLVLSLSFLAFPPVNMFSVSRARWMKSGIASFAGADLSHVFKGSHSKSFFFSGLERGLGGASGQTVWIRHPRKKWKLNPLYTVIL